MAVALALDCAVAGAGVRVAGATIAETVAVAVDATDGAIGAVAWGCVVAVAGTVMVGGVRVATGAAALHAINPNDIAGKIHFIRYWRDGITKSYPYDVVCVENDRSAGKINDAIPRLSIFCPHARCRRKGAGRRCHDRAGARVAPAATRIALDAKPKLCGA